MNQKVLEWIEQGISLNPPFLCIFFIVFVFLLISLNKAGSSKYMNLPPSPSKLPFIGNLHQLHGLPHHTLLALSQKYGPVMLLQLGRVPTLVVSSADVAQEVLKRYDHVFSSRPFLLFLNRLFYGKGILIAPYGEYWRQVRRVCVVQLLSAKKVQSFRFVREQEVALMIETIKVASSSSSSLMNLSQMFVALTSNIICRAAVGRKYKEGEGNGRRRSLKAIFNELAYLMGVPNVGDFIPSLSWVNHLNGLNARVEKNFKEIDAIIDEIVEEHMEKRKKDGDAGNVEAEKEDFVDVMLRTAKDETLDT